MTCFGGIFDWDVALARLDALNAEAENPDLWNDPEQAQKLMQERTRLEQSINLCRQMETDLQDNIDLIELAELEGDDDVLQESEQQIIQLAQQAEKLEVQTLLSGEADANNSF